MAKSPNLELIFQGNCPDCGVREVHLPKVLPPTGDDFDWRVRDYDGYRLFMLEELSARFPERKRWTPADLEVVLIEVMSTVLDQLSDMQDRVATEVYLETARRPETVRQLLNFIGYDAIAIAKEKDHIDGKLQGEQAIEALEKYWRTYPNAMEKAKRDGPRSIHTQKRMVTTEDYAVRLQEHPLVLQAHAWTEWTGSWLTVNLAIIAWDNMLLDTSQDGTSEINYTQEVKDKVVNFHEGVLVRVPNMDASPAPSVRMIVRPYIDAFRMVGQEVILQDPVYVGIYFSISVRIDSNFFQSEMRYAIKQALGQGPGGFFEAGQLSFGEDLYASDLIEALMNMDGIENVCLNRFKRIGNQYLDSTETGFITMDGIEVAVCKNDTNDPARGYYRLELYGGRKG